MITPSSVKLFSGSLPPSISRLCSVFMRLMPLFSPNRSLPPLAKKYVLQLLYIDSPIAAKSIEEWVLADGSTKHKVAIDRLIQLRLLSETFDRLVTYTIQFFVSVFLSMLGNSLVNKE